MREYKLSITMVNWNGEKWLKKCFDSLKSQNCNNFVVIFVDNGFFDDNTDFVKDNFIFSL